MAFTTWLGMYLSGVGTGMGRPMREALIHADQHLPHMAPVFCAAASGSASPATRGAPIATSTTRAATAAISGSVV